MPHAVGDTVMEGEIDGLCERLINEEGVIKLDKETKEDLVVVPWPVEVVERHSVGD